MIYEAWADLHIHTTYSDGILLPKQVVRHAKKVGLKAVGIADHDTLNGIAEAREEGRKVGIEIVPGIELSSQFDGRDIHILAYYCDHTHPRLIRYLEHFRDERYKRAMKMVENLQNGGVRITLDEVQDKASGKCIGRPHIAEILMEKGYVETFQEAFYHYIGYGSKAYEEKFRIAPEKAIGLIAEAGGLSFLAHPGPGISYDLMVRLAKAGLDGLEIVHPKLSEKRTQNLQQFARNYGLLVSGGSDCHGGRDGRIFIGDYRVPYSIVEEMRRMRKERKQMMTGSSAGEKRED